MFYALGGWMFVCLFGLSKGLKQMGGRMQIFVMIGVDLCFQLRFSHVFFFFFPPDFWKGGGLPQYAVLGSHSFLLHLNSQRTQKAEDLFLLYDLLYPWGQGQPWAEQGGHGHSPGFWVALVGSQNLPAGTFCMATSGTRYKSGRRGNL